MTKQEKISTCVKYWLKSQKPSKWLEQDKKDYIAFLNRKSDEELNQTFNNLSALNSDRFEHKVNKELDKMDKSGLFNISKMTPFNALD